MLPKNSVVIMEVKHELQRLEDDNFWSNLTSDKMEFLDAVVKPLLRTVSDVDFKAMRFEKDIVEVSLAHLTGETEPARPAGGKFETLKESIIEEIGEGPPTYLPYLSDVDSLSLTPNSAISYPF